MSFYCLQIDPKTNEISALASKKRSNQKSSVKESGKNNKNNFTKSLSPLCKNVFVPPNLLWTIMARNDDVSCMLHKRVTIHNSIISSKAAISNTEKGQHYLASPQPCRTHNLVKSFLQEHSCFLLNASFQIYFFFVFFISSHFQQN